MWKTLSITILSIAVFVGAASAEWTEAEFPLSISSNHRYLVDAHGEPFFYQADTPWMIFLKLTLDEAEEYMAARKAQGFTALQVQLTGFLGDRNRDGQSPFDESFDFSKPNEAYFAHVDRVIEKARDMNLFLAIAPLWKGCCGEGWAGNNKDGSPKPMNVNGVEKCREFGRYLGTRYGRFNHIMWIMGGDNDPGESRDLIRALAEGIKEKAPRQFCTYHAASSHSSTDVWPDENWLDIAMVYTYFRGFNKAWNKDQPDVYEVSYREYHKTPVHPFFLGESTYEGEHGDWGTALQARKQAYWCVLSGGMGHAYGSDNWPIPDGWRKNIKHPGAESMKYLRDLVSTFRWTELIPDEQHGLLVKGSEPFAQNDCAASAVASDGSFALVYVPTPRELTIDASKMAGEMIQARWYDPTSGTYRDAGPPFKRNQQRNFFTDMPNKAGDSDWVLVLEAKAR
ncbi:MAG: DUF4038 domain-containing protein [bacterium]|nr:DUF4038 domain-containing protein [bacterium]